MFHSARIKLTFWYLLIIMTISLAFSATIYGFTVREVRRFSLEQRRRLQEQLFPRGNGPQWHHPLLQTEDLELVETVQNRTLISLAIVNGVILLVSGGLGYVLAGKTLEPIQDMVDEQNRFISDASHELKTPLTSLKTSFEVFLREKKPRLEEARELIDESVQEVNKLQQLSEALLSLAQFQKTIEKPPFERIDLQTHITTAVKRIRSLAQQKHITIKQEVSPLTVSGDVHALSEVWSIILDNAIKYSPPQTAITISTSKSGNISFTDQGIGISKEEKEHIFERFYRADKARSSTESHGFGLGLPIARHIIKQHGGSITVESKEGKGSTFIVKLPLVK